MAEGGHGRRKKSEFVLSMSNVCSVSCGTVFSLCLLVKSVFWEELLTLQNIC